MLVTLAVAALLLAATATTALGGPHRHRRRLSPPDPPSPPEEETALRAVRYRPGLDPTPRPDQDHQPGSGPEAGVVVGGQEPFGGHSIHGPAGSFRCELLPHQTVTFELGVDLMV
jgi:hypothetical protein